MGATPKNYDAFLSHSHADAAWVEGIAQRLEDECGFQVWLDRWRLIPGKGWVQGLGDGLRVSNCCVVCMGAETPEGWFLKEIQNALNIQAERKGYRVLPVLLPGACPDQLPDFLGLNTWADFRAGQDEAFAFHVLKQGIKGEEIGRWPPSAPSLAANQFKWCGERIRELRELSQLGLHDEVAIEFERKIMDQWLARVRATP